MTTNDLIKGDAFIEYMDAPSPVEGHIVLVGCGFLGSIFAEELAKRLFAFDDNTHVVCVDSDAFERRNAANQNTNLNSEGVAKADWIDGIFASYNVPSSARVVRVVKENVAEVLGKPRLIVSAVDNMPTRRLLWYYAKQHQIPLLHLGVSQEGTGAVEWTIGDYDTWSLSPLLTIGQRKKIESDVNLPRELKPCELIAFRGVGLNIGIAAAKAVGIWMSFDAEKEIAQDILPREYAVTYDATNYGHSIREKKLIDFEEVFPACAEEVANG